MVLAGYNHDIEPAPLKIYVGMKGIDAAGNPVGEDATERDQFLARNGLLHGKIYGLALANDAFAELGIDEIDTGAKMIDAYMTDADAPDTFEAAFAPTSYQWGGWDAPVSVRDTEMLKWAMADEQPAGHTFFVGDSKTEHPAVDPDPTKHRYVQNMTQEGGMLAFDFGDLGATLAAADGALPAVFAGQRHPHARGCRWGADARRWRQGHQAWRRRHPCHLGRRGGQDRGPRRSDVDQGRRWRCPDP
jgi:hypothetical protein